jgi:hypothetical protein
MKAEESDQRREKEQSQRILVPPTAGTGTEPMDLSSAYGGNRNRAKES